MIQQPDKVIKIDGMNTGEIIKLAVEHLTRAQSDMLTGLLIVGAVIDQLEIAANKSTDNDTQQ